MSIWTDHVAAMQKHREENPEQAAFEDAHSAMEESAGQITSRTTIHLPPPGENPTILPSPKISAIPKIGWWKIDVYKTSTNKSQIFSWKRICGERLHYIAGLMDRKAKFSFVIINGVNWYIVPWSVYDTDQKWSEGWRPTNDQRFEFQPYKVAHMCYGYPKELTEFTLIG